MTRANNIQWPRQYAKKISLIHFGYFVAHFIGIIIFDSWNLLTPEAVKNRWTLVGFLLIVTAGLYYGSRLAFLKPYYYRFMIFAYIVMDLVLAAFYTYWERGMASLSVALFFIPIIVAAGERSRALLVSTAVVTASVYTTTIVRYFNESPSEGFRIQLYGTAFMYSAVFFVAAALLIVVLKLPKRER